MPAVSPSWQRGREIPTCRCAKLRLGRNSVLVRPEADVCPIRWRSGAAPLDNGECVSACETRQKYPHGHVRPVVCHNLWSIPACVLSVGSRDREGKCLRKVLKIWFVALLLRIKKLLLWPELDSVTLWLASSWASSWIKGCGPPQKSFYLQFRREFQIQRLPAKKWMSQMIWGALL